MVKVSTLFDTTKFEQRKTADQSEFEEVHKDELPVFYQLISEAFEMTKVDSSQKRQHFKDKNYHAVLMSGNIRGLLLENFPGFVKEGANDRIMFCKQGKFCIYFKKLDDRKMPSNVKTEYSEMVAYQKTIAGGEKMPIIFVGYTVKDDWSELTGIFAVYIEGHQRKWVTVINKPDDKANLTIIANPVNPAAPKPSRVRRKAS
jgi:hypothetical protein